MVQTRVEQRAKAETPSESSVCWHRWVAIRKGNRTCYAQWEDCGPFRTDHFQYVFQNERPKPNASHGTGLSVSPAVRDYLGLAPIDVTDWQFVEVLDVAPGPWRSLGENNHFVSLGSRRLHSRPRLQPKIAPRNLLFRRNGSVARWRLRGVVAADNDPMSLIWRGRLNRIARAENGEGGRGKSEREQEAEGGGAFHSCHAYVHQACQSDRCVTIFARTGINGEAS